MAIQNNFPNLTPTLLLDFANAGKLDPRVTFSRSTTATYFNSLGVLTTANNNVARFDYDPSTLAPLGLLIEEQRTNSIRNNTMVGAVAGTPGTAPTNWLVDTTGGVFTRTISGPSTESGITYIDIQVQASAGGTFVIRPEPGTQVAASVGQVWANTAYVKLAAGSLTNAACSIRIRENDSGGSILSEGTVNFTPTSAGLATQRVSITRTLASATVAFIQPRIEIIFSGAGDLTLRIGLPQLEQGAFATSVIPTTTTALTRNADVASMTGTNFSSWYNASEGTLFTSAAGVANVSGATRRYAEINDSGSLERIIVGYSGTTSTRLLVQDGGATQADIAVTTPSVENVIKMAAVYKTNDFQQASNGNLGLADTSGTLPTVDRMFIGSADGLTANTFLNGTIQRIAYYPVRVTDAQLQALTG
jgi:hypothetical protein